MHWNPVGAALACCIWLLALPSPAAEPIAHYPLTGDPADATGRNGPMTLVNAPFDNGGIYCNGILPGTGDPETCRVTTPQLSDLDFEQFSVSVAFMIDAYPTELPTWRPIVVGGADAQWLGIAVSADRTLGLFYNRYFFAYTGLPVPLNEWCRVTITYDGSVACLYHNERLVVSRSVNLNHHEDRTIALSHDLLNNAHQGWLCDLRVFNLAEPLDTDAVSWGAVKSLFRN